MFGRVCVWAVLDSVGYSRLAGSLGLLSGRVCSSHGGSARAGSGPERELNSTSPMQTLEAVLAIEDNKPGSRCVSYVLVAHDSASGMDGAPVRNLVAQQLLGSCEPVGVVI